MERDQGNESIFEMTCRKRATETKRSRDSSVRFIAIRTEKEYTKTKGLLTGRRPFRLRNAERRAKGEDQKGDGEEPDVVVASHRHSRLPDPEPESALLHLYAEPDIG